MREKMKNSFRYITGIKKQLFFILLLHSTGLLACKCASMQPLTSGLTEKYEIIFKGKIDSVSVCGDKGMATAYFTIQELYKGIAAQQTAIHFDCVSSCMMNFSANEEWLVYANYQHFDHVTVTFCSPSRKFFQKAEEDFNLAETHRTYEEEKKFLKNTLGLQPFFQKEKWNEEQAELKPHNEQPSDQSKVYLLLVSFGIMILIYILTRKKKRKNGE